MEHYFVSELYPQARHTAGVLREDIETVLREWGFAALDTPPASTSWFGRIMDYSRARRMLGNELLIPACVFFHFPVRSRMNRYLFAQLKKRGIKTIAYIHDFEGMRDQDQELLQKELSQLKQFDIIIAQNRVMKEMVEKETGNKNVIELEMYDYLEVPEPSIHPTMQGDIIFAGNLEKAPFITQLETLAPLRFTVFGEPVPRTTATNILYKGSEDPRILPSVIAGIGSFGLVWDGSSIQTGKGAGDYLRVNMPHKLSLYIMAGLPPIVWKESAMAEWVQQQQIGIVVSSLYELKEQLEIVTENDYRKFQDNMKGIRQKMAGGYYLQAAIRSAEQLV
ncbi:MAG TPA: hypothetical protein VGO58_01930 [Chitinophagaceae bacterium]|jgi:hypothetical protein|nr:hypothetical protein [Chitinophagaceae bacterium]